MNLVPEVAAFAAGVMNSVAGGGSFLSFPALVFAGVPPISANATNNAAMWVGTIGSARGYREEVREHRSFLLPVISVSVAGALIGACLLLFTPPTVFQRLIPWLLLFATLVFAASPWMTRDTIVRAATRAVAGSQVHPPFRSKYGGYFWCGNGDFDAGGARVFGVAELQRTKRS